VTSVLEAHGLIPVPWQRFGYRDKSAGFQLLATRANMK